MIAFVGEVEKLKCFTQTLAHYTFGMTDPAF